MKTTLANGGGVSVAHGTAVWSLRILESMDSFRVIESRVGVLAGERMMAGVDVDTFIGEIWKSTEKNGFMELRLMLSSGQVVEIDSVNDSVGPQVLAVRFDESTFPAGLNGRWFDRFAVRSGRRSRTTAKVVMKGQLQ